MIPEIRKKFNDNFKEEFYENLLKDIKQTYGEECAFRISETPVFIDKTLKKEVFATCESIIDQLGQIDFEMVRNTFIPKDLQSPVKMGSPHFLAIDFGLCNDGAGNIAPKLIELQAFPTLFFYQPWLGQAFQKHYNNLPKEGFHYYFSGLNHETYKEEVRKLIIGSENPKHVVLMEIFPKKQKTRIDFWATQKALGIDVVCMTDIFKEGKKLYYNKEGEKIHIKRIYNRVIMDEIERLDNLDLKFNLHDDLEVEWVSHPDWFFMISKCILPLLRHDNIPNSYYLNNYPSDLNFSDFVLKPLFSFAGQGINLYPDQESIDKIEDKENYILQQKVEYASLIKTNTEKNSKVELRMLFIWNEEENRLKPVINLTRMSKGELINVSHLTQDSWIGSSISFFEE